jgi:mannose-6-phosphate isomerase
MNAEIVRCSPIYKERIWGSSDPHDFPFGRVPSENPVGEAWDISDIDDAASLVRWKSFRGSLRELLEKHGTAIMGPAWSDRQPFPIMVKRLFCAKRLSLQVHPPRKIAQHYGHLSKDEFWFILGVKGHAGIFAGLRSGVTKEEFTDTLRCCGDLEPLLHRITSIPQGIMGIPSGRLHAIDAGNTILEIQESSDTTYRVFDWNRNGLDGMPRELHVDQAIQSTDFSDFEPSITLLSENPGEIVKFKKFTIRSIALYGYAAPVIFSSNCQPRIIHAIEGEVRVNGQQLRIGESAILSFCDTFFVHTESAGKALITENFFFGD